MRLSLLIAALVVAIPTALAQSADVAPDSRTVGKPAASSGTAIPWNSYGGGPTILFDQLQLETPPGSGESVLQNSSLGMTSLGAGQQSESGNFVAEDFVVPVGQVWTITDMNFYGYQTGADAKQSSTFTSYVAQIWDGSPDNPASSVIAGDLTTNILSNSVFSNIFRVSETTLGATNRPIFESTATFTAPVELGPGTYWVQWGAAGSLASGPWQPPVTITGETSTGNSLQLTSGGWNPLTDGGTLTPQGLPFQVLGTTSAATGPILAVDPTGVDFGSVDVGNSSSQDITLTSAGSEAVTITSIAIAGSSSLTVDLDGTSLSLAPGESTTFEVSFDPTELGAFAANITIDSNNPDGQLVVAVSGTSDLTSTFPPGDTAGGPVFARPDDLGDGTSGSCAISTDGSAVAYETIDFSVDGDGAYDIRADWSGGQDGFLLLYEGGSFDPNDVCTGLIGLDDDEGGIVASLIADVTLSASETYTIVATGFDNVASGPYTVSVTGPGMANVLTAGEQTATFASSLSVAPNPSSERSVVRLDVTESQDVSVAVFDAVGRRVAVLHQGAVVAGQTLELTLNASALPSGVYVVRALSGADALSQRFTVIR